MRSARRLVLAGAVLIGAGIVVVLRQAATAPPNPELGPLGQWVAGAEFPGLPLILAGAALWGLAAILN
jgi:drug/metabolite transporter (DMT)-like permease